MKKIFSIILLLVVASVHSYAADEQLTFIEAKSKTWNYIPVNEEFWSEISNLKTAKNWSGMESKALEKEKQKGIKSLEGAEAALVLAQYLRSQGLNSMAFEGFLKIAILHPGSMPGFQALLEIDTLAPLINFDEEELARVLNLANFLEAPPEIKSMVSYYVSLDNMKRNLKEWIVKPFTNVEEKSIWGQRLKYFKALELVKAGKVDEAELAFDDLSKNSPFENIRNKSALQQARLLFEKKYYDDAENIYAKFLFPGRDFGRALLERAWIKYYKKEYSISLGMIEGLKSPYFDIARTPEQYLLSMIIYRDLCHYPSVKDKVKEFQQYYGETVKRIQSRKSLLKDDRLLKMVFARGEIRPAADYVSELRDNLRIFSDKFTSKPKDFYKFLVDSTKEREGKVQKRLDRILPDLLNKEAEIVLQANDRIRLLDYVSELDELRIKKAFERRSYAAEKAQVFNYDKLFWPIKSEHWWEEINNYRVVISDRCSGGGL